MRPRPEDSTLRIVSSESHAAASLQDEIDRLCALGPEAQGDSDDSLLQENLRLTPCERLEAAGLAADAVEALRAAVAQLRRIRELRTRSDAAE